MNKSILAVVLAAGRSTRFKSLTNKLMMPLCGRPLVYFPLLALQQADCTVNIVVGKHTEYLKKKVEEFKLGHPVSFSYQKEPLGTGDALQASKAEWHLYDTIMVINGDMPLVTSAMLSALIEKHYATQATVSFVTSNILNPVGYGRVAEHGKSIKIIEEKDCTPAQKSICKVNAGIYLFKREFLEASISQLTQNNANNEFYITDLIHIASQSGLTVTTHTAPFEETQGVNTIEEFWAAEQLLRRKIVTSWHEAGVTFENPQNLHIDIDVEIGEGTRIGSGVLLLRGSKIGKHCSVSAFSIIANSLIGDNTIIKTHTVIQDSVVQRNCQIGPFARIRNNSIVGDFAMIENFVELNNCTLQHNVHIKRMCCLDAATILPQSVISLPRVSVDYEQEQQFELPNPLQQQHL